MTPLYLDSGIVYHILEYMCICIGVWYIRIHVVCVYVCVLVRHDFTNPSFILPRRFPSPYITGPPHTLDDPTYHPSTETKWKERNKDGAVSS